MAHSFVAARLQNCLPSWCVLGQRAATKLITTPFLALHLHEPRDKDPLLIQRAPPNLFLISQQKPVAPGCDYFVLDSSAARASDDPRSLKVVPSLPFKHPLYLSITPRFAAQFPNIDMYDKLSNSEQYQLDKDSLKKFQEALERAGPSISYSPHTGGEDIPGPEWDTWSAATDREAPGVLFQGRYLELFFDVEPFETLSPQAVGKSRIYDEVALLRQYVADI